MTREAKQIRLPGHGLSLNALEFEGDSSRTVVIVHGYLDQSISFAPLAKELNEEGARRVIALDMRGHGQSDWAPKGGYYYFADYIGDVSFALDAISPSQPITLIGHSMGGNISTMYAGTCPERIAALVLAEGVGIMEQPAAVVPLRFQRWLQHLRSPRMRNPKVIDSLETAVEALTLNHGRVSKEILQRVAHECTKSHPVEKDKLTWVFDPLLQSVSPTRFDAGGFEELARNITAPTLLVGGGIDGMTFDGIEDRLACYKHQSRVTLEGAGHMMHWTKPAEFAQCIKSFLQSHQR